MTTYSIHTLLTEATGALTSTSDSPRLDAELLLGHALQQTRSYLHAWPEHHPTQEQSAAFQALLQRRRQGEPIAHILGTREFWSLELQVTPDTLIPRPDTELLVEHALLHIPADRPAAIADLGTGTGAIALAIASERPRAHLVATDRSTAALAVAHENAIRLGIANVVFQESDWCEALAGQAFDVIVSNPPYIAEQDPHLTQGDARFDPITALVSGPEGLDDLRRISHEAMACLKSGGWLLVEHGYDQGPAVIQLLSGAGYQEVRDLSDLAGNSRVTKGQKPL